MPLPAQLTSFVGRHAELREIAAALAGARLVTLAGPGGCGKTRLAVEAARQAADRWPDPYWIDLTTATDPAAVPELAAAAFGVLVSGDAVASVARQVRNRRMLVCLDNCEHVLGAAADLAAAILRGCPEATVLATSREQLAVPGEVVWRVPPLQVDDAIALFNARAGRAGEDNAVRTACLRLDGMPLAVELAAAWSGTLSPDQILDGLDDRFGLLIRGPRGVAARHQTLAASMAWSHDLLDEPDRVLFCRLGVFHGGFTAAAAEGIGGSKAGLRRLIEKSLLIADTRGSVARYRMLETVREYALSRLVDRAEAQDRHLDLYLATAESVRHLLDEDKDAWRAAIEADYENFRAAIDWGLSQDDADRGRRLAAELAWFWHSSRRGREGLDILRRAVERAPAERTPVQARLLTGLALVADTTQPRDLEHAALDIATEVGDADTGRLARLLTGIGLLATDFDQAWRLASDVEQTGDGFVRDAARALMGIVCHLRDEHERAMPLLQAAVDGLLPRRDRGVAATALGHLAISTACTGDVRRADELAREAVRVAAPLGDYHRVGSAHCVLAQVEELAGRLDAAWAALDPVLRLVDGAEPAPFVPGLTDRLGRLHLAGGQPGEALRCYQAAEFLTPSARVGLAIALRRTGDVSAAARQAEEAQEIAGGVGMPGVVAEALQVRAELEDDPVRAEELHHEALVIRAEHGLRLGCVHSLEALAELAGDTAEAARLLGACDRAREEYGHPRLHSGPSGSAEGRTMTLDEAIAYARRSRGTRSRPASGWASLTPTEQSVVKLAVEGLSNPDIGRRLFMSRATVKTHLSHVYAKLGVANRTELATVASTQKRP